MVGQVTEEQVDAIGYLGGALLAGCFVPQIIKVLVTRSVQDISVTWSLLYTTGLTLTTVYLMFKDAPAAWIPSLFELIGGLFILALKLFFENTAIGLRLSAAKQQQQQQQLQQEQEKQQLEGSDKGQEPQRSTKADDSGDTIGSLKTLLPFDSPKTPSMDGFSLRASYDRFGSMRSNIAQLLDMGNSSDDATALAPESSSSGARLDSPAYRRGSIDVYRRGSMVQAAGATAHSLPMLAVVTDRGSTRGVSAPGYSVPSSPSRLRGSGRLIWAASSKSDHGALD